MQEDSLMNRALLKQDAKDAMKAANPHPVLTTLVFWAIQLAAQIILGIVSSICGFTTYFSAAISSGMYEDSAFLNYAPSIGAFLIYLVVAIVIGLLIGTVQFGYYAYSLKVFKHEEAGISELLAYFPMLLKIFYRLPILGDILYFSRCHRFAPGVSATAHPSRCAVLCSLVMEQSDSGKYHRHVILITAFDDRIIADGAAGLCNVFYAALMCAFDVIGKREECVRTKGYIGQLV